ncbi:MAG: DUF1343 domain-containing protein [Bacteroidales bacterium]|nr:DUF1343 domain-containing protein [Bacteroidales bacterium]
MNLKFTVLLLTFAWITTFGHSTNPVIVGAEQPEEYLPLLQNKRIALLGNHTSRIGKQHLLDYLLEKQVNVVAVFSPEHGFRGTADAGELIKTRVDEKTGVPILSLYDGKHKKPSAASVSTFDLLLVDIQDVGLRFYTYYIAMLKLMDVCAEFDKKVLILDRPNPNGHYVDGPILQKKHYSGVGALPIPVVHGMTLGELALMINGEEWLSEKRTCKLQVIPCKNYTHQTEYQLPIPPSPNLPNMKAIYLYPSLCFFEGTTVSVGRGTSFPFQIFGHPKMINAPYSFTPKSKIGAKNPPHLNRRCFGYSLTTLNHQIARSKGIDLSFLIHCYNELKNEEKFFNPLFNLLIGVDYVRSMISKGASAEEIKNKWKDDVDLFKQQRKPYLLYEE